MRTLPYLGAERKAYARPFPEVVMSHRPPLHLRGVLSLAWLVLGACQCSTASGPDDAAIDALDAAHPADAASPSLDSGGPTDASAPDAANGDAGRSDAGKGTDAGAPDGGPSRCEPACLAVGGCVTHPGTGLCVECLTSADCASNPAALGNVCDEQLSVCRCASDAECSGKTAGAVCTRLGTCGCSSDEACRQPPFTRCGIAEGAVSSVCQRPCSGPGDCVSGAQCRDGRCTACVDDSDCGTRHCSLSMGRCVPCADDLHCAASATNPHCDRASGDCAICTADAHCLAARPFCARWLGGSGCVACLTDLQCAGSGVGGRCTQELTCGCTLDADCLGPETAGTTCFTGPPSRCGCRTGADCVASPRGPTCHAVLQQCTCASDADCRPPHTLCAPVSAGSGERSCRRPCTADADCRSTSGLAFCQAGTGKCVECRDDSQCPGGRCSAAGACVACLGDGDCPHARPACVSGKCVECRTKADCAALLVGGDCDTSTGRCTCAVAADCAGSLTSGSECVESSLWGRRCGCGSCVGNVHGAQCALVQVVPQCTCRSDQECTLVPHTRCAPLDSFSGMSECKPPCTSDADCDWKATGLRRCSLVTGKCGVCGSDGDCASERFARHCSPEARCVQCNAAGDCAGSPLGPWCGNGECRCTADAECSGRSGGKHCDEASFVCSCRTDGDCPGGTKCLGVISVGGRLVSLCQ